MKTNFFLFLLAISTNINLEAQTAIDDFKYVSVPESYSFLKSNDQYQLNSLTVFLFEKNNFKVLKSFENYPSDLAENSCLLLKSDVISVKGFLKTKLQLTLTDCRGNVVFTSEIGESKLKEYKKAFHEALRSAFVSVGNLNYEYNGSIPYANTAAPLAPKPPIPAAAIKASKSVSKVRPPSVPVAVQTLATENTEVANGLIVKKTNSGYDFIDNVTKRVSYSTQETLFDKVYIIEGQSGIIYKRGSAWVWEYYEQNKTIIETLDTLP